MCLEQQLAGCDLTPGASSPSPGRMPERQYRADTPRSLGQQLRWFSTPLPHGRGVEELPGRAERVPCSSPEVSSLTCSLSVSRHTLILFLCSLSSARMGRSSSSRHATSAARHCRSSSHQSLSSSRMAVVILVSNDVSAPCITSSRIRPIILNSWSASRVAARTGCPQARGFYTEKVALGDPQVVLSSTHGLTSPPVCVGEGAEGRPALSFTLSCQTIHWAFRMTVLHGRLTMGLGGEHRAPASEAQLGVPIQS